MRLPTCILTLILLCLSTTGCSTFDKKSGSNGSGSGTGGGKPDNNDPLLGPSTLSVPAPSNPFSSANQAETAGGSGAIVAGRVVDMYDHGAGGTFIKLVCLDDKDGGNSKDVAVQADGYFVIAGLRQGAKYKLLARARNGDQMQAGETQTAAPNIRVVIQIRQDLANADTPPIPGAPAFPGRSVKPAAPGESSGLTPDPSGAELATLGQLKVPGNFQPVEHDLPVAVRVPSPPPATPGSYVPGTPVKNPAWAPVLNPPTLEIAPPAPLRPSLEMQKLQPSFGPLTPPPPPPPLPPVPDEHKPPPQWPALNGATMNIPAGPDALGLGIGPARVPSCILLGNKLENFALSDAINGHPWEFRQRTGKVILVDFWASWCGPCLETIPKLRSLQARYGKQVEVIGIAYEQPGSPQEQAYRVNAMAQKLHVNYRLLMGGGPRCPVRSQFRVEGLPTLILIDENGTILWRHEGMPDSATMDELERGIQRQLTSQF